MKDPAFLFYSQDFIVGVQTMTFEERGQYITILSLMHQQGRMEEKTIRFLVGSISDNLKSKFSIDENGFWFNDRLEREIEKRKKFTESRVNNGKLGGRPKEEKKPIGYSTDNLIENENVIENVIKDESILSEFHKICIELPKVQKLTDSRKKKLTARKKEISNIVEWINLFTKVSKSDFLCGRIEKWQCTFDWLIENDKNYLKVIEGNYDNKSNKTNNLSTGDSNKYDNAFQRR